MRAAAVLLLASALLTVGSAPVSAKPSDHYSGPHFGDRNLPPECAQDESVADQLSAGEPNPNNVCHYMRTGMNSLDSPQVDVLVMVPVSPTAERDMRLMRQAVEMWEGGIEYLATEMGLNWMAAGMEFHISLDYFDPLDNQGGEFTTYPLVDPEIVVIAANPAGGFGIGFDPVAGSNGIPCRPVANPFDFQEWENLPGFNSHHDERTGTYVEDCGGAGGNVCFAINAATDPAPDSIELIGLFDLVAHELGHCLTIGHVGDATDLEGHWGAVPEDEIMAYSPGLRGLTKCVSTLDVESIALSMSGYLDVNGDRKVDEADLLLANDQAGDGINAFQVQHRDDHLYASATGNARSCPQPDLGLVPGPRTDWSHP